MVIEHGPSIGTFKQKPIPAYIVTENKIRWKFHRVANLDADGGFTLSKLKKNECVIAPGLIYIQ